MTRGYNTVADGWAGAYEIKTTPPRTGILFLEQRVAPLLGREWAPLERSLKREKEKERSKKSEKGKNEEYNLEIK